MKPFNMIKSPEIPYLLMGVCALLIFCLLIATSACRSSNESDQPADLMAVKSPVTGEVRRILVGEGLPVNEGAAILEIAVKEVTDNTGQGQAGAEASARSALAAAQKEIADAESDSARAAVEVQRVQSLVATGAAPQSQLDAANAQYQQAQERLQRVRERAQSAQRVLTTREGSPANQPPPAQEKIIEVRVPSSGVLRVLNARVGQRVTAGQTIATLSKNNP